MTETLIIAHRCAELAAYRGPADPFARAVAAGADMAEVDLRRTGDGVFIGCHGPRLVGRWIRLATYAELRERAERVGLTVLRLEEILERIPERMRINVELKGGPGAVELARLLQARLTPDQFMISSFQERNLAAIKRVNSEIEVGLIYPNWGCARERVSIRRRRTDTRADFVLAYWRFLREQLLDQAADRGLPIDVWTVNEPIAMRRYMQDPRIRGLITDRPGLAATVRADAHARIAAEVVSWPTSSSVTQ